MNRRTPIFEVSFESNDCHAFRQNPTLTPNQRVHQQLIPDMSGMETVPVRRCPACNEMLDKWNEPLHSLVVKNRKLDLSETYDGITIASVRFRELYSKHRWRGLTFRALPMDSGFYAIRPDRAVEFDAAAVGTAFEDFCAACHQYGSVIGVDPLTLKGTPEVAASEFVRTDLEFASNDEKSPMMLCGVDAARILKAAKFKMVDVVPVG